MKKYIKEIVSTSKSMTIELSASPSVQCVVCTWQCAPNSAGLRVYTVNSVQLKVYSLQCTV